MKVPQDPLPSGAILMANNNGKFSAIGLKSFASKKNKTIPVVFTKVDNYITWIKENTVDGQYCDN
ncbi:hypothetical protein B4U80_13995 [Leptotrombidium deliense]|uniref:Peptidase S1 domain-containing protein n=1 Tax=Leptotrombidium deliense TaxID=299467 RepID=A0A443S5H2_9ACAR|nr:hypothetical protein B4U80_13995 [Leptotrombidium deliense]